MKILHFLFGFVIFSIAALTLNFALVQRTKLLPRNSVELDSIVPIQQEPLQITDPITSKSRLNKRTKRLVDRHYTDKKKEREMEAIRNYNKMRQIDKSATNKVNSFSTANQIPFNNGIKIIQKNDQLNYYLNACRFNSDENSPDQAQLFRLTV